MSDAEAMEAEAIVRALATLSPSVTSEYACFFCGAGDPVDKPIIHTANCLHLRASSWTSRRWERDEGWRRDAVQRLNEIQDQLSQGRRVPREQVERILAALEDSMGEPE